MSNFFIVLADDFETKIIVKILKRNNKELVVVEEGEANDQISKKIEKAVKKQKQIIFVGCEPDKEAWTCHFGGDSPKYKVITYKGNKNERSTIEKIETILKKDILIDFERIVSAGVKDYVSGMNITAKKLGMSSQQKQKNIKNALRGSILSKGISRQILKDVVEAERR